MALLGNLYAYQASSRPLILRIIGPDIEQNPGIRIDCRLSSGFAPSNNILHSLPQMMLFNPCLNIYDT